MRPTPLRPYPTPSCSQAQEAEPVQQQLFPLQAQRFSSEPDARAALETMAQRWRSPQVAQVSRPPPIQYDRKGRPTPETPIKALQ